MYTISNSSEKLVVAKERLTRDSLACLSYFGDKLLITDLSFETNPYVVLCIVVSIIDIDSGLKDLRPFIYAVLYGLTIIRSALPRHSA